MCKLPGWVEMDKTTDYRHPMMDGINQRNLKFWAPTLMADHSRVTMFLYAPT